MFSLVPRDQFWLVAVLSAAVALAAAGYWRDAGREAPALSAAPAPVAPRVPR